MPWANQSGKAAALINMNEVRSESKPYWTRFPALTGIHESQNGCETGQARSQYLLGHMRAVSKSGPGWTRF